jgi:hypothetical protein
VLGLVDRFGPEYSRAVDDVGSRPKAEAELRARQKRVAKLDIVPLTPADADRLLRELMQKRGSPRS